MSWGLIDDGYWDHPKTLALIAVGDEGLRAAGAFWLMVSYCNRKHATEFTIWEAAMVLRRPHDEVVKVLAPLLRSTPEFGSFLLQSQPEAYVVNDIGRYRIKNEARARAGSQGGKKSGEKRREKSKQNRSKPEADAKQAPSKVEPPISYIHSPRSVDPIPSEKPPGGDEQITDRATLGNLLSSLEVKIPIGAFDALGPYLPCTGAQVREAVRKTQEKLGKLPHRYVLTVLATEREKPTESKQPTTPDAPRKPDPKPSDRAVWDAMGDEHGMTALLVPDERELRAMKLDPVLIETHVVKVTEAARNGGPTPTWRRVIDSLRSSGHPGLRAVPTEVTT